MKQDYFLRSKYESLIRMSLANPDAIKDIKAINAYYHYLNIINGTALIDKKYPENQFQYLKVSVSKAILRLLKRKGSKNIKNELQQLIQKTDSAFSLNQIDYVIIATLDVIVEIRKNK
ncbi:MAG TPA: hypothetical protein PKW69_00375 [Niabella sp.]|nr:hypothetical protein [Niabella sp.]